MKFALTRTQTNFLTNLAGNIVPAALGFLYLPAFDHLLGPEATGVIAFYLTLQLVWIFLVAGVQSLINREIAAVSGGAPGQTGIWALLPTLERVAWLGALLFAGTFACAAVPIAQSWLTPKDLTQSETVFSLQLCGAAISQQLPMAIYAGVLYGVQRHASANAMLLAGALCRLPCTHLVLYFGAQSIELFFAMQVSGWVLQVAVARLMLWREWRACRGGQVKFGEWGTFLRQALVFSGYLWLLMILTHADRLVLSRVLSLADFGRYYLLAVLASGLTYLSNAVQQAVYPRLADLCARKAEEECRQLYRDASQLTGALLFPLAVVLAAFPEKVLAVWLRRPDTLAADGLVLRLLVVGWALHAIVCVPISMWLVLGHMRLLLSAYGVGIALYLASIAFALAYEAVGVAAAWLVVNGLLMLVVTGLDRTGYANSLMGWLCRSIVRPVIVSSAVVLIGSLLVPDAGWLADVLFLGTVLILSYLLTFAATPLSWVWLRRTMAGRPSV